jgi:ribosomal protein L37AE/L43A
MSNNSDIMSDYMESQMQEMSMSKRVFSDSQTMKILEHKKGLEESIDLMFAWFAYINGESIQIQRERFQDWLNESDSIEKAARLVGNDVQEVLAKGRAVRERDRLQKELEQVKAENEMSNNSDFEESDCKHEWSHYTNNGMMKCTKCPARFSYTNYRNMKTERKEAIRRLHELQKELEQVRSKFDKLLDMADKYPYVGGDFTLARYVEKLKEQENE